MLAACSPNRAPPSATFVRTISWAEKGTWLKADTHIHTKFSDGGVELDQVVDRAVANGCQVIAITDHADAELAATSDAYFAALEEARQRHPELILLAGLEWNVPPWEGREHATLLLSPAVPERQVLRDFQVLFDDWKRDQRDPELALKALLWLQTRSTDDALRPVVIYNHPSRKRDDLAAFVDELTRWQQASAVAVGFEGGPGHQDSDPIGAYSQALKTSDRWDPAAAEVGGAWDLLLGRGLPVWGAVATSDFHQGDAAKRDDYWPGEFSETWLYAPEPTAAGALAALRAGSFFGVHGQIARQVQLRVLAPGLPREAVVGEALHAVPGTELIVTMHLEMPLVDWQGEPNRIDEVELIGVTGDEAVVVATRTPTSESALRVSLLVPEEGVTLRARGRREVIGGPDLMFYTNPIQVFTDARPMGSRRQTDSDSLVKAPIAATTPDSHAPRHTDFRKTGGLTRHVPAWIPLGFIVAASVLASLIDRWQLEIRRRFVSLTTQQRTEAVNQSIPRGWRRYFFALLLGFVFLAVYGSLVPWQPAPLDWSTAIGRFQHLLEQPVSLASRSDFATNVLLFLPIGFLATGLVLGAKPGDWRRAVGIVLVVVACAALSLAIEFAQLWVADRTSSQNDVVAETLGGLIGATAWLFLGPLLIAWLNRVLNASRPRERVEHMLEAYVAIVAVYMLMPLDLTLRPGELYDKFQDGRINLVPLADIAADPTGAFGLLGDLLLLVPLGMLAALWRWPAWERVRPLVPSLTIGLLVVALIELAQLLVMSRYSSTTDLITGSLGVIGGWAIADRLVRANANSKSPATHAPLANGYLLAASAMLYALLVAAVLCFPFEGWATSAEASQRLAGLFSRPPLAALYWGTELNAVSQMLRKILLFIPLGGILILGAHARWPDAAGRTWMIGIACLVATVWAVLIEVAQVWLPPHVPDFTDAMLATLGAALGIVAVVRVLSGRRVAPA